MGKTGEQALHEEDTRQQYERKIRPTAFLIKETQVRATGRTCYPLAPWAHPRLGCCPPGTHWAWGGSSRWYSLQTCLEVSQKVHIHQLCVPNSSTGYLSKRRCVSVKRLCECILLPAIEEWCLQAADLRYPQ